MLPNWFKKMALFPLLFIVLMVLSALIDPMKTLTDIPRNTMNCPNTANYSASSWNNMTGNNHTIYSTGCYALHWDMLLYIGVLAILAIIGWLSL